MSVDGRQPRARILIADDHDLVRASLAMLLSDRWEICGEASNGVEAVEKARDLQPDLVLLDLSMPLLSGTKAAQLIRDFVPTTKILIVSKQEESAVANITRITGADGFVSKYAHAKDLTDAIAALLPAPTRLSRQASNSN